jgi:hypothetical protein
MQEKRPRPEEYEQWCEDTGEEMLRELLAKRQIEGSLARHAENFVAKKARKRDRDHMRRRDYVPWLSLLIAVGALIVAYYKD